MRDISESVINASGAALAAGRLLRSLESGEPGRAKEQPSTSGAEVRAERSRARSGPGHGVLVALCSCSGMVEEAVDFRAVGKDLESADAAIEARRFDDLCTPEGRRQLSDALTESGCDRVVLGTCLPYHDRRKLEGIAGDLGVEESLIAVVDVCSAAMAGRGREAAERAGDVRARLLGAARRMKAEEPPAPAALPVMPRALVVGGGIAGLTAALAIAEHGHAVDLVERENELGGGLRWSSTALEGHSPERLLEKTLFEVQNHPLIRVHTGATVVRSRGEIGDFTTTVRFFSTGGEQSIRHGVTVLATGAHEAEPTCYGFGSHQAIVTQGQLERRLRDGRVDPARLRNVAMIQCVESREEPHNYCSRVCCRSAIENALALKEANQDLPVWIFYRDVMTYGFMESYYTRARREGVLFVRYPVTDKPQVSVAEDGGVTLTARDPMLDRPLTIEPDLLVLSNGLRPSADEKLAAALGVDLDEDGFFACADYKWRPVETAREGVFVCGTAHSPRTVGESAALAEAAAQHAVRLLDRRRLTISETVAVIDVRLCTACKTCVGMCPYGAVSFSEESKLAAVNPVLCQGCGTCAAACPVTAIRVRHFTPEQVFAEIEGMLA
jgi:heterodisulfide reductase subunit A